MPDAQSTALKSEGVGNEMEALQVVLFVRMMMTMKDSVNQSSSNTWT